MTTTAQHRDRPPAASGPHGQAQSSARSRRATLDLAVAESSRLLRHPAVLAAAAFGAVLLWSSGQHIVPVLSRSDIATQIPLAPLAAATLLATNLAALRAHRDGADDLYGACRLSVAWRTLAHLLSMLPLVALGGGLVAADLAWLARVPGRSGVPSPAELATGPALVRPARRGRPRSRRRFRRAARGQPPRSLSARAAHAARMRERGFGRTLTVTSGAVQRIQEFLAVNAC